MKKNPIISFVIIIVIFISFLCGCSSIKKKALYPLKSENQQIIFSPNNGFYSVLESRPDCSVEVGILNIEDLLLVNISFINSSDWSLEAKIDDIQLKDSELLPFPKVAPDVALKKYMALYNKFTSRQISTPVLEKRGYENSSGLTTSYKSYYGTSLESEIFESSKNTKIKNYIRQIYGFSYFGNFTVPPETKVTGLVYFVPASNDYPYNLKIKFGDGLYNFKFSNQ